MAKKILVTGASIKDKLLQPLINAGYEVEHPKEISSEGELSRLLVDCEAYIYGGEEEATPSALATAKNLKLLAFYGVGYESFMDVEAIRNLGLRVTNTPGTLANSVAEMTIAQLINCRRKLTEYAINYMQGAQGNEEVQSDIGSHPIGIVGLGEIGTRVAEILTLGFGCTVTYYSRTRKPEEEKRLGIGYCNLQALFERNEAVIVMTPGNSETVSLISSSEFESAKDGLILVNTARPEIVDQESLLNALTSGKVSCAAFDKFYAASDATEELLKLQPKSLLITNHIGSLTHDARDAMTVKAVNSVLNFLSTERDDYLVV